MLSSKDGLFDRARGRLVGSEQYLTKPFTKDELLRYLQHGREKSRAIVAALTDETAREVRRFIGRDRTVLEWLLVSMRHVQHHTAQLNLILRQQTDSAPTWVARTPHPLG